jgi:hypothetical protein
LPELPGTWFLSFRVLVWLNPLVSDEMFPVDLTFPAPTSTLKGMRGQLCWNACYRQYDAVSQVPDDKA